MISKEGQNANAIGGAPTNFKDGIETMDFGMVFGMGIDWGKFNVGLRYSIGLTNIFKFPEGIYQGFSYKLEASNMGWQIVAGYKLF